MSTAWFLARLWATPVLYVIRPPRAPSHDAEVTAVVEPSLVKPVLKVIGLPLLVALPLATTFVIAGAPALLRKR